MKGGSYVFDASAIIKVAEIAPRRAPAVLKKQHTADLAYYEIGNYIWKLKKREVIDDAAPYVEFFSKLLAHMTVHGVGLRDEVLDIATRRGLTYYDAVYLWLAESLDVPLVTEDGKLCQAAARCLTAAQVLTRR